MSKQTGRLPPLDKLSGQEYDDLVLSEHRESVACACRDLLALELNQKSHLITLLEVAAGTGIGTNRLNELTNLEVTALDKKRNFLEHGIEKGRIKRGQEVVGDFNNLPFKDDSFDVYTGIAFLNHRHDPEMFYWELLRVLRKGGLIFLPWTKKNPKSMEPEKELWKKFSIKIIREGDWFLIGEK